MITNCVSNKIDDYVQGVLSGEIVACLKIKQAVQRYVDDMKRQSTEDFPYRFDKALATDVCQFFPLVIKHSIGEFAGRPFEIEPWQMFCVWNIFGWLRDDDNSRRFRKVYLSVARKNGKSSLAAAICLFLASADIDPATGKPEAVGQILLAATKKEQAAVVYSETERMRNQSKSLQSLSKVKHETITFTHNGTYIRKVSSDRPLDGMNPSAVILDELHAFGQHHRKFYDTMVTGSASRTQPLQLMITTAGADDSHLWLENYQYAASVLDKTIKDDTIFIMSYELDPEDDPGDENVWLKANPNLGISVKPAYLKERWNEDRHTVIGRSRFVRYHGNRMVSSSEKAFDPVMFDKCLGEHSDWSKADAIGGGVDHGSRDDLSAYALCARFLDPDAHEGDIKYRFEIKVRSWISSDTRRDLRKAPFAQWIYNGDIEVSKYPCEALDNSLIEACAQYGVGRVAYDPYNGQHLAETLEKNGIIAARVPQNQINFNEAIRDFIWLVEHGKITFSGGDFIKWCAGNAIISRDRNDRFMFDKRESSEKIDPIVAAVMAYRICSLIPDRPVGPLIIS